MKLAMVFPGQGSQSVGMLQAYAGLGGVEDVRREAEVALGSDFLALLDAGPAEALNLTVNTQPAMVTAGYAAYRAWCALGGPRPEVVAGHSLGEYTALVAAGAIAFRDCLPLVRFRAQAMQEAVPEGQGAMAAILNLDDAAVRAACEEAAQGEVVQAVNFNAPGQVVIAGHKAAVARAMEACKARGAKRALPLPVSAPFHSSLMRPAAEKLRGYLERVAVTAPTIALVNNVDVATRAQPSGDQGCAGAAGGLARALGRDHPEDEGHGRDARPRMRPRQGARGHGEAHRWHAAQLRTGGQGVARAGAGGAEGHGMTLAGKLALVTGATRGIGRAIALQLGRDGATVIGTATTQAGAAQISEALSQAGVQGAGMALDVRDTAACDALLETLQKERGDVLVLVNNAGITRDNLALRMKDAEWDEVMETNLKAVFRLSRAVMRGMMKARWGRIINITSVVGASGNPGQANYAAAKAGVVGMTKSLSRELGSRNITVNCVAPGFIDTDMTRALPEAQRTALLGQIPLGRLGAPEDIAAAVAYLASPAAGYVTGCVLHVNGGMYMA